MKGVIVTCLKQMVNERHGSHGWEAVLRQAKMEQHAAPSPIADLDDATVLALMAAAGKVLELGPEQVADAFGEHWCCTFAPENYPSIVGRFKSAREMLLGLARVHRETTASVKNARPPAFDYRWQDERTLVMTYHSSRHLIDFAVGLARGVGKHFGERIVVRKLSSKQIEVVFP